MQKEKINLHNWFSKSINFNCGLCIFCAVCCCCSNTNTNSKSETLAHVIHFVTFSHLHPLDDYLPLFFSSFGCLNFPCRFFFVTCKNPYSDRMIRTKVLDATDTLDVNQCFVLLLLPFFRSLCFISTWDWERLLLL